ncbi:Methanogenesis regulatory histidine kinase FilI [uncultured archaeon]|nr:Methanogenesis regulatory histidine kinase FilI [uncultured archaeon]
MRREGELLLISRGKAVKNEDKAKEQIIKELRQRIAELEKSETLRKRAKETLRLQTENPQELSTENVQSLIHEQQVHQIELEMQNEELRRVQNELKEARNKYSDLYDFAPIGYFTFDKNGLILEVNLTGANKLGVERSFLIKKPFSLYVAFSSRNVFYLHLRQVFKTETRQTCEIKLVDQNKNQFNARLESLAMQDGEGKSGQCRTAISDITEHKQMDEALLESEERHRELAESIDEVFYAMDRDLKYIYWNNASEKLTGISSKDAVGKSLIELFPELKGARAEKLYMEVLKTHQPQHFVHKYLVEGKNLFFEINAYPSKFGISVIAKNITQHKLAEEQIREQASLLDKAHDAIVVRDLKNRFIYWNKGAERLYGWTAEEAIGKNAFELLYKGESPILIKAQKSVIEMGEWSGELHKVTKDGKEIIVESRWTLVHDNEGKPRSILVINTDITEKKKLEAHLLRAQRMESLGTLAGGIAHDLNNVLTPMMLSLQMLKEKFKDEQSQKLLSILEKNSQRGANLIKQVLSFARGVEGERNPLQAKHIISEVEKVAKETFPRNIEIQTDVQEDLWTIAGDTTQLYQVLMNLCVNARDAMLDGGILRISAKNFFVDKKYARMNTEANVGSYVFIAVTDTGTGIPPEIMDRIFEPFFTTKEHGKGTGLGLSTSLGIVKSHCGFINVYSKIGKGTTFKVYLPAIKAELQTGDEQQFELPIGQGELILVAEDEGSIREVTTSTLETYGYRVLTADDGAQAVMLYAENKDEIKVILMDMMMPVMDGQASIRAIRKINPEVKIIVVSGLTDKDMLLNFADYSNAFLPKPYTTERLLKTLHEVLSAR